MICLPANLQCSPYNFYGLLNASLDHHIFDQQLLGINMPHLLPCSWWLTLAYASFSQTIFPSKKLNAFKINVKIIMVCPNQYLFPFFFRNAYIGRWPSRSIFIATIIATSWLILTMLMWIWGWRPSTRSRRTSSTRWCWWCTNTVNYPTCACSWNSWTNGYGWISLISVSVLWSNSSAW